jgi:hypothetical protein
MAVAIYKRILTDHVWRHWQEWSGIGVRCFKLIQVLTGKLNVALAVGLVLDHTGTGWLEVNPLAVRYCPYN